jgi:sulfotransferase family protein
MPIDYARRVAERRSGIQVVYILGSSRGGTSIVGRFLGLLGGATFGGELRRLWGPALQPGRGTCGCGKPLPECEIWSKLLVEGAPYLQPSPDEVARLQNRVAPIGHDWWHAGKILRRRRAPSGSSARGRYLRIFRDLYEAFAAESGSTVVVDSSKNASDAALLAFAPEASTYCVHVVRDPRGVVLSRRQRTMADPGRPHPLQAVRTTIYWMLAHSTAEAVCRRYGPERSLRVQYEQFADDPASTLGAVASLVGVKAPSPGPSPWVPTELSAAHGPDGHGRFSTTEIVLRKDERWTTELHAIDRFVVGLLAYPLLRRYGYSVRSKRGLPVSVP